MLDSREHHPTHRAMARALITGSIRRFAPSSDSRRRPRCRYIRVRHWDPEGDVRASGGARAAGAAWSSGVASPRYLRRARSGFGRVATTAAGGSRGGGGYGGGDEDGSGSGADAAQAGVSENEPAWRGDGGRLAAEQAERASARETTGLGEPPPFCHQPRRPPSAYAALYPASSLRSPPFSASASSSSSFLRRRRRCRRRRRILYSLLLLLRRVLAAPFGSFYHCVRPFVRSFVRSCIPGRQSSCRVLANVCETRLARRARLRTANIQLAIVVRERNSFHPENCIRSFRSASNRSPTSPRPSFFSGPIA